MPIVVLASFKKKNEVIKTFSSLIGKTTKLSMRYSNILLLYALLYLAIKIHQLLMAQRKQYQSFKHNNIYTSTYINYIHHVKE